MVYLIILLTQEEKEHSQLSRQISVEILVRSIHFVHFIHPHMNPSPSSISTASNCIPCMHVLDSKPLLTFSKNVAGDLFANQFARYC